MEAHLYIIKLKPYSISMKKQFLALLMLTAMFWACVPRTQEITPYQSIDSKLLEIAKVGFEQNQTISLSKPIEATIQESDNRINLWESTSFRTFNPVWNKTEQVTLLNGNKVLITPLRRNLNVDYGNLYYIRRLRIELNAQNQVVKANIVELITLKHTVASQKYQIIANVFEEIQTRTDAKILVFDAGYTPQIESGSWKGETINSNNTNAKGDDGTPPDCYQLIAVVGCSDIYNLPLLVMTQVLHFKALEHQ